MSNPKRRKVSPSQYRVVGYVRISKNRTDQTSIETQRQAIEDWCQRHGYELVAIIEEPGRSAFKQSRSSRPGFRQVRQLIESGAANCLAVWKLSRVARNTLDTLQLVEELGERSAIVASVTEPFDMTTPMGRAMVGIIAVLAELESAAKSENIEAWQDYRFEEGLPPTGPRPYGYRRERNALIVEPSEQAEVARMAAAILGPDSASLRSLAAELNERGVTTSTGGRWSNRAVAHILTSPTTAGLRRNGEGELIKGCWEPLIPRATWDQLVELMSDPSRRSSTSNARRWMLSGIATCGRCQGVPLSIRGNNAGPRYTCVARSEGGGCSLSIDAGQLDAAVEREVLAALDGDGWRKLQARARAPRHTAELRAELIELAAQYERGEIELDEWKLLQAGIRRRLAESTEQTIRLPDVGDVVKDWRAGRLDLDARRLVVSATLDRLVIAPSTGARGFDSRRIDLGFRV